jgi:hypothetical protein
VGNVNMTQLKNNTVSLLLLVVDDLTVLFLIQENKVRGRQEVTP